MADNSSIHRADIAGLSEDDPFAELTRIMGHEPRREPEQSQAQSEDLALELENELLADLADVSDDAEDEVVSQQADWQAPQDDWRTGLSEPQESATEADAVADPLADELDAGFSAALEDDLQTSEGPFQPVETVDSSFSTGDEGFAPAEPLSYQDSVSAQPEDSVEPGVPERFEAREDDWAQFDADFSLPPAEEESLQTTPVEAAGETTGHGASEDNFSTGPAEMQDLDDGLPDDLDGSAIAAHHERLSADKHYLSPQDFAQSVAQGREQAPDAVEEEAIEDKAYIVSEGAEQPETEAFSPEPVAFDEAGAVAENATQAESVESAFPASWEMPEQSYGKPELRDEPADMDAGMDLADTQQPDPASYADVTPFIDTVEVPDEGIAVDDARHIPEFKAEPASTARFDDLEAVLARAFGDADDGPVPSFTSQEPEQSSQPELSQPDFARKHGQFDQEPAASISDRSAGEHEDDFGFDAAFASGLAASHAASGHSAQAASSADADFAQEHIFWDEPEQGAAQPLPQPQPATRGNRRGLLVAAAVGGVAVLGALGVFALTSSGDNAAAPVLVRADDEPMKIKPENPGGQQVPNQDSQVYERVAGEDTAARPAQETLVSSAEEPADVTPPPSSSSRVASASEPASGDVGQLIAKSEERLNAEAETTTSAIGKEVAAVSPRRVRTMIVRPDGTIVPRPVSAPSEATSSAETQVAAAPLDTSASPTQNNTLTPTGLQPAAAPNEPTSDAGSQAANGTVPSSAPIPASRPASASQQSQAARPQAAQPAAAPQQTAAIAPQAASTPAAPAAVTAPTGEWSVQISSQPSVEGAQQSYRDIAQRHGDLLAGKGVNIVKADIAGKGTYYRVRIPSASKDAAIQLCSQLKSAGGSCFVSK